jgi:5-oxoprolinase (ATP-hydrolysing) subunit A
MVLINCDMGEGFGIWRLGDDAGIMPSIHIANVARGFHGSDFNHMRTTVRLAKRHGVRVAAHPPLPDLQGFGRREMKIGREELANCLTYQIGALKGFLYAEGMTQALSTCDTRGIGQLDRRQGHSASKRQRSAFNPTRRGLIRS